MIYPCDIHCNPEHSPSYGKLICEIIEQEDKLLNGWIRVHITERPIGLPLCSLSRKIKGLMVCKPDHNKIFAKKILELLDIAKLMAKKH